MSKKTVHDADAIINRHLGQMMEELHNKGYGAMGVVSCVVGGSGKPSELDTNIGIGLLGPIFDVGHEDPDAQSDELLAFVWATIAAELEKRKAH